MKILLLQDDFPPKSFGGAGIVAHNVSMELVRRGHEVRFITAVQDRNEVGTTSSLDGKLIIHRIEAHFSENFQAYWSLWKPSVTKEVQKILTEFKPDIVHAHGVHAYLSYGTLIAAKKSGAYVVLTCHDVQSFNYGKLIDFIDPKDGSIPQHFDYRIDPWLQARQRTWRYNPFRNPVIRWIIRKYVDMVTAVSFELKKALEANGIENVNVIHNGIDVNTWTENTEETRMFRDKYSLGNSVILFGGRISPVKGSDKLLEALVEIRKRIPDAQLLVASQKDEFFERLLKRADKLGVADCVIGTGWISGNDLKAAYYSSSVVTVPTLSFDSFPTMNLEAFACKKPVVATCFGGSREIVEDGVSGYVINPYDVSSLSEKIEELLLDRDKAVRFGEAGHKRVLSEFSIEKQAKAFEEIYVNSGT